MRLRVLVASVIPALVLTACSSTAGPQSAGGAGPSTTASGDKIPTAVTVAPGGEPKRGGKLVYGLEADTDGFDPAVSRMVANGLIMANAVYDPLAAFAADGSAKPYLAEKIEPSADFRTWTITLRKGITFHNGERLDADAVMNHFSKMRKSPLTNAALDLIDETTPTTKIDDPTFKVNMLEPWAQFPVLLTGQLGIVPSPAFYAEPDPKKRSNSPIGTGPFKLLSREPNVRTELVRNPDYWRKDERGTQLPYLDGVAFTFFPQNVARDEALDRGDINMMFTTFGSSERRLTQWANEGKIQVVRDTGSEEQVFLELNMDAPPLDDLRVRQAINYAIDRKEYVKISDDEEAWIRNNVFSPSSPWFADVGTPPFDAAKAKDLVAAYTKEKGQKPTFAIKTNDSVENQKLGQWFADQLNKVGMDVKALSSAMETFPTELVFGKYEVGYVRQFGAPDPEGDAYWFLSKNASKPGEGRLGLNIARLRDPEIDKVLAEARATTDAETRKKAYRRFQERITELVPYVWLTASVKMIATDKRVRGITNGPLPDGSPSMPIVTGVTRLSSVWLA